MCAIIMHHSNQFKLYYESVLKQITKVLTLAVFFPKVLVLLFLLVFLIMF